MVNLLILKFRCRLVTVASPSHSRNLAVTTCGELLIVFSKNLLNSTAGVLFSASDKAKLFAENFSKNSNFDDSGIFLPIFPSITNLKVHNISVSPKMVKKVIMSLDLSKASDPDCILVVVLKNCEPKLSDILAELFNTYLKESWFPDCWKVSSVVPVFKNIGERPIAKNYHSVSLLSVVSKVSKKL